MDIGPRHEADSLIISLYHIILIQYVYVRAIDVDVQRAGGGLDLRVYVLRIR